MTIGLVYVASHGKHGAAAAGGQWSGPGVLEFALSK